MSSQLVAFSALSALVAFALVLGAAQQSRAADFYVGAGGPPQGCTHSSLDDAISAAQGNFELDTIFLANDVAYMNQAHVLSGFSGSEESLSIVGGFDTCDDTEFGPNSVTTIHGTPSDSVFTIENSNVFFAALELVGSGTYAVRTDSNTLFLAELLTMRDNGGGLFMLPGAGEVQLFGVDIRANTTGPTGRGGGIRCDGGTLTVVSSTVRNNGAQDGGGLFVATSCSATLANTVRIEDNVAARNGGGIYLEGTVSDPGRAPSGPSQGLASRGAAPTAIATVISGNTAVDAGGAIYATNFANYDVDNTRLIDNQAGLGGAAFVTGGSILRMFPGTPSCGFSQCVAINENTLGGAVLGSAIYAEAMSEVYLFGGFFEENHNTANTAYPFYLDDAFGWFEGVQMWANTGPSLVWATNGSQVTLAHLSVARNETAGGGSPFLVDVAASTANIYSSALQDIAGFNATFGGTIPFVDCVVSNTLAGAVSPGASLVADPEFRDPAGGDLRLQPNSIAVDYCDTTGYLAIAPDPQGEARGYDHEDNSNGAPGVVNGTVDLGFDEVWYFFADGFETGDTTAWTSSAP